MAACEMCGKITAELYRGDVEGVEMTVCRACSSYGKGMRSVAEVQAQKETIERLAMPKKKTVIEGPEEFVVENYAEKIRKARETLGLPQKEFAMKLAEKESLVHALESGHHPPSIPLAKKLEKILHINLVETAEGEDATVAAGRSDVLTVGDLIKKK